MLHVKGRCIHFNHNLKHVSIDTYYMLAQQQNSIPQLGKEPIQQAPKQQDSTSNFGHRY